MVIRKFDLKITARQTVEMPFGADIISVQQQGSAGLQLWAIVDPDRANEHRVIEIVGTETSMQDVTKEGLARLHLATVKTNGGLLVWHVFELM